MQGLLSGVWRYRSFVISSIAAEINNRVSRSRLGVLWIVISPLAQVAIFALILSAIMSERIPGIDNRFAYTIYLIAGFLPWYLFVEVMSRSVTMFVDNANAMKKIVFPKVTLAIVVLIVGLINNMIFFAAVALIYTILGHGIGAAIVWLPVLTILTGAFALSIGIVLGTVNVFIRDVGQMVPILLQLGFWFTPIVYTASIVPELYRGLLQLNPLYWIVSVYRDVLVFQQAPDMAALGGLSVLTLLLCALAAFMFRRAAPEMVDVL
jgi:lipopolysaccharide transport system permease protein